MNPESLDGLLSVPEAAAALRVSEACIRSWLSKGLLRRWKAGRRTLILREDLREIVTTPMSAPTAASL